MPIWEGAYTILCKLKNLSTTRPFWNIVNPGTVDPGLGGGGWENLGIQGLKLPGKASNLSTASNFQRRPQMNPPVEKNGRVTLYQCYPAISMKATSQLFLQLCLPQEQFFCSRFRSKRLGVQVSS